jgi:acyl carrier protein
VFRVRVVGSFPVEPLGEVLRFWDDLLEWEVGWELAPPGPTFQTPHRAGDGAVPALVALVRAADWQDDPARSTQDLVRAVRDAARSAPAAVVVSPSPPDAGVAAVEDALVRQVADVPGATVVSAAQVRSWYPDAAWQQPAAADADRMPYPATGYAALGAVVTRTVRGWVVPRPKAIVATCDDLLWDGEIGEVGASGVGVPADRALVQQFLAEQVRAGRSLCLYARGDRRGVESVLRHHPDMLLRQEHVTAAYDDDSRPVLETLRSCATELGLGLDQVAFLDTNPIEVAQVRQYLPELTALLLPAAADAAAARLAHCWPLDAGPDRAAVASAGRTLAASAEQVQYIAGHLATADQIRAAVHAWRHDTDADADDIVPAQTATQHAVMLLWADLLTPPPRSIADNFFELSGDSLKLVQFMGMVRRHFGVELPTSTLFESTLTVAEVAAAIEEAQLEAVERDVRAEHCPDGVFDAANNQ